jgi:hypothetical protein
MREKKITFKIGKIDIGLWFDRDTAYGLFGFCVGDRNFHFIIKDREDWLFGRGEDVYYDGNHCCWGLGPLFTYCWIE